VVLGLLKRKEKEENEKEKKVPEKYMLEGTERD
jgi:hypothetical protein